MVEGTAPSHEIIVIQGPAQSNLKEQCYSVRIDVFHHEQGFPLDTEFDEMDDTATHFLLRLVPDLTPVGTIRAYKGVGEEYYKLSRLAVLKDYRRFYFGRKLVEALHDWVGQDAKEAGADGLVTVVSHSQIPVKGFYGKFGYLPEGDEFDEDGAPHQKMVVRLSLPP